MCECVHCVTVYGQRKPPSSPFVFVHVCILFRSIEMRTKALDDNFCMKLLWPFECTAYNNLARESRKRLGIMLLAEGTFRRKLFKPVIELSLEIASLQPLPASFFCGFFCHNGFIKRAFDFGSYLYYHHDHHTLISQMEFLCLSAIDRYLMCNCILH